MGELFSCTTPIAADYSGAASVFYDLNGITVICDASGCVGAYLVLDEPRLYSETKKVFHAAIRERDVVMGIDRKLKRQVVESWNTLGGECVALIGTPVPAIMGSDLKGIAKEIQPQIDAPVLGIDTNGLDYYDEGQRKAYEKLLEVCVKPEATGTIDVNVIGATPIDMWDLIQTKDMLAFLKECGAKNPVVWGANGKMNEIAEAAGAKLNIAVSASAVSVVKEMEQKFGIPYLVGYPIGEYQKECWRAKIKSLLEGKGMLEETCAKEANNISEKKRVLIIGEQLASNSLRWMLKEEFNYRNVDVVSQFRMYDEYMRKGDIKMKSEEFLIRHLKERERYDIVISDPIYFGLVPYRPEKLVSLPHIAVSSRAFWDKSPNCFGEKGSTYFKSVL